VLLSQRAEPLMPTIQILNPDSLGKPLGQYSQITRVKASEFLFIAGQVGAGKDGKAPVDFDAQCGLVFANLGTALSSQGASFANVVEFTTYLVPHCNGSSAAHVRLALAGSPFPIDRLIAFSSRQKATNIACVATYTIGIDY
jgi:enamine deaminase RidA (YjgF/YER057c/UK114 family)